MSKTTIASIIIVILSVAAGYYLFHIRSIKPAAAITSFEDCARAGYPILETYPEQCKTPDGKTFTNINNPPLQSGITGMILLGPTCPVERIPPDPSCADKPYQATLAVTTPDGSTVLQTFSSDANGKFSVMLQPGEYAIQSPLATRFYPRCSSRGTIQVAPNSFTETTIYCDTGIR